MLAGAHHNGGIGKSSELLGIPIEEVEKIA
jgi:hypothetical protein